MTLPNFLIIGAAKAGTTSLYHYLKQHPQIYMSPIKEPRFFVFDWKRENEKGPWYREFHIHSKAMATLEDYRALFKEVKNELAIGEATPRYLYDPEVPTRIHHYIPHAKMIAILRNPVDRAYSHFLHLIRDGYEPIQDFTLALQTEEKRMRDNWGPAYHYKNNGFYASQIQRYLDVFDKKQIKIYLYEDFSTHPLRVLQDIFRFLKVDDQFVPDLSKKHNESGFPRKKALHTLLTMRSPIRTILAPFVPSAIRQRLVHLKEKNLMKPPPLSSEIRKNLTEIFRKDILKLQTLIERDLSHWLA